MSLGLAAGPSAHGTTWAIGETEWSEPTGAALSSKARGGQNGSARFGFPASSFQYRELIPRLADRYRVIAPDLPGFGFTAVPEERHYKYTFDALALPGRLDQRVGQGVQEHEGHADPGRLGGIEKREGDRDIEGHGQLTVRATPRVYSEGQVPHFLIRSNTGRSRSTTQDNFNCSSPDSL